MATTTIRQLVRVTWTLTAYPGQDDPRITAERTDLIDVAPSVARGRTVEESIRRVCAVRYLGSISYAPHVVIKSHQLVTVESY